MRLPRNFNPLHREGGDSIKSSITRSYKISIHSTARVETWESIMQRTIYAISIHSTARVETPITDFYDKEVKISIHSTARVETAIAGAI